MSHMVLSFSGASRKDEVPAQQKAAHRAVSTTTERTGPDSENEIELLELLGHLSFSISSMPKDSLLWSGSKLINPHEYPTN